MPSKQDQIIWENVERLVEQKGISLAQLARKMGTTPQSLNQIKTGIRGVGGKMFSRFAEALEVDETRLLIDTTYAPQLINKPIPVISTVHAGEFLEAMDHWPEGMSGEGEPVFSFVKTGTHAFGLIVEGLSMSPRFLPGDVVIVDPSVHCHNGCACVVWLNGEVSLKTFFENEAEIILKPINEEYATITISKNSKVKFKIIGKVVDLKARF